jgi:uncharacterized membrane protein YhaH (DUF805 family)
MVKSKVYWPIHRVFQKDTLDSSAGTNTKATRDEFELHGSEYMDIMEIMKFSSEAKITRMNWWMSVVVLMVINVVLNMVGVIPAILVNLLILVPSIAFAVSRLRDRGHSEPLAFALRLIIFPWGLIECGFLAGTE